MNAEQKVKALNKEFGSKLKDVRIHETVHGKKNIKAQRIWATVKPADYKKVVEFLFTLQDFPHHCVSSGTDMEKEIEIVNHFGLGYGIPQGAVLFNLKTSLPKTKPNMDSITDLIPGAWIAEKEKQEFLGINVKGIPPGRLFLDDSLPKGVFPWRKDAKGPGKNAINLHTGDAVE